MTTDRTPARVFSDDQVADILQFLARTCLEVERGLRPPDHLASLMDRAAAHRWDQLASLGRFRGGPVHNDQIGRPQVSRLSDTHIVASVSTRTEGNRWGALTLSLRAHKGRWRVADVQRLLAATTYRTTPATPVPHMTREDELARVTEERRLAQAAHQATSRRLADLAPGAPGYRAARDLARYWRRTIGELDCQLAEHTTRQQSRGHVERALRR